MAEPKSTCGACGQTDDHPKHQVVVGFNNEHTGGMFHEHDADRDGVIHYHFDCPSQWHGRADVSRLSTLAASGVRGDDLRARIMSGEV